MPLNDLSESCSKAEVIQSQAYLLVFGRENRKKLLLHRFLIALFKLRAFKNKSYIWDYHRIIYPQLIQEAQKAPFPPKD